MNTVVTSKEEILAASRELIRREGWSGVGIRSVAAACGVSVGCIYNYFGSKAALVSATVESVWREIFCLPEDEAVLRDIRACVVWLYRRMEYGGSRYPGFFTLHALGFMGEERADGKRRMQQTWRHILEQLQGVLARDESIPADAFTGQLTAERFADLLFSLMLSALLRQDYDPGPVLEVIRRTLCQPAAPGDEITSGKEG